MRHSYIKNAFVIILAIISMIPSLLFCRYTYPVQDDFHYAYHARLLFEKGYHLFSMSWAKMVEYYLTFTGCYTSSFFGHFFSGIIQCNPTGIQIFCFVSLALFYLALYLCISGVTRNIFKINLFKTNCIYCLLIFCFTGLIYYAENEDYYWFITSVQYLLITSCILVGVYMYIQGLTNKRYYLIGAGLLGFLGAGGALNIAAMCFLFFSFVAFWGVFILGEKKAAMPVWLIVTLGGIINGIAPGNYIRYGKPLTIKSLLQAIFNSYYYTFLRIIEYLKKPLFIFILIALAIVIFLWKPTEVKFRCRRPVLFMAIWITTISIVIFPVMLGYGYETYMIICRSNFISDLVIFFAFFIVFIYWRCWIFSCNKNLIITRKAGIVCLVALTIFSCLTLNRMWKKGTAFYRQVAELKKGTPQEYAAYWIDVYKEIEESAEDIVVIYRDEEIEDMTCLINPVLTIGEYDYEHTHGNRSIAQFYGKKAVLFLINSEED
ncbi:MAG: DUF6056 family protein [Lachnospiraceae bacterium]